MVCGQRMYTDPVCGMQVPMTTPYKTIYKGRVYFFCSEKCKTAFEKDPEYYLTHGPVGMPGEEGHPHSH